MCESEKPSTSAGCKREEPHVEIKTMNVAAIDEDCHKERSICNELKWECEKRPASTAEGKDGAKVISVER